MHRNQHNPYDLGRFNDEQIDQIITSGANVEQLKLLLSQPLTTDQVMQELAQITRATALAQQGRLLPEWVNAFARNGVRLYETARGFIAVTPDEISFGPHASQHIACLEAMNHLIDQRSPWRRAA